MKTLHGLQPARSLTDLFPQLAGVAEDRRGLAELASALVQLRSRAGMKQSELADAAGVPATLISELENARNDGVTWRTIVRLVKGSGAKLDLRFSLDPCSAGEIDVHVEGDYADAISDTSYEINTGELAAFINERNDAAESKLAA